MELEKLPMNKVNSAFSYLSKIKISGFKGKD